MTHCIREINGELVMIGGRYGVEHVGEDVAAFVGGEPLREVELFVGDFEDLGEKDL